MDAQQQFEGFLSKYEPGVAAEAKKSLAKLRKLIPNAIEMVYDNYNALVVGFCPGKRPSEAILSIAVMPEWVSLCFLQGARLPDPGKRLEGSGNVARHIKMKKGAATLDEPAVKTLIEEALTGAKVTIPPDQQRQFLIKSVSVKQRPRRPGAALSKVER
ncbi:MAG TPA: DUF1801 domain-containing protein [Candidatus Acidoferrum sp.]|nr:DUF1801 domain-containing protein [Candidatus Acidoferrum sp.]